MVTYVRHDALLKSKRDHTSSKHLQVVVSLDTDLSLDFISLIMFMDLSFVGWRKFLQSFGWLVNFLFSFLALIKSIGLRNDGRLDDRSYWVCRAMALNISLAIPLVYPRMIAIHDLISKVRIQHWNWIIYILFCIASICKICS